MDELKDITEIQVGIVGLGLMGSSITTCLLIAGHPVIAVAPISADMQTAPKRIWDHLSRSKQEGLVDHSPENYLKQLTITEDYALLRDCTIVIECTLENLDVKKSVYQKIESVISEQAILASNTSAIPISMLQEQTKYPARFLGLHWAEPSHTTRFLEIICGDSSDISKGEYLYDLAHHWGKEPTLVRKDIRGFISNRLMYALFREAFYLVENGYATVEDGKAYGDLLAFKWATDAKGMHIVSADGKPVLTQAQEYVGNFNPKSTFGFTNTINIKRLSLRLLVDGRVGGTIISGTEMNLAFSGIPEVTDKYREGNWSLGGVNSAGQPVTKAIAAQDFWQIASGKRYGAGEFFAYDATSFRAREFSIGYQIPIQSTNLVKAIRLSAVGRNLFWLYRGESQLDIPGVGKRKMWFDPDMSLGNSNYQGVEYGTLPSTRSYGLNLQVTF